MNTRLSASETTSEIRNFLARSAIFTLSDLSSKAIIVHTVSGDSARIISAYRGKKPIFAKCFDESVVRELALSYGLTAYLMWPAKTTDQLVKTALKEIVPDHKLKKSDLIVVIGATPKGRASADFLGMCFVKDYI